MFNATEFVYDGIHSAKFGLKIATFNGSPLEETPYITKNLVLSKSILSNKFHYVDATYEEPPKFEFTVVSEGAIHEDVLRDILLWLDTRRGFKPLMIMQHGLSEHTYNCIFTVTNLIFHSNSCVGLNLTATFDMPYICGKPIELTLFGNGETQEITLYNDSDNLDNYVYPLVVFDTIDGGISIINTTDSKDREFLFSGLNPNVEYKVDNELKIITGEGKNLLGKFNKNWLRVLRGKNILNVRVNGAANIICPRRIIITF